MRPGSWRIVLGLAIVFGLFHWVASALGSDRGQRGLLVGAIVVAATIGVERAFFGVRPGAAVAALGLSRPTSRGLLAAGGVGLALLLVFPAWAMASGERLGMYPHWWGLVPGLFAQAGVAEEVLFRGYLFRRMRPGRSFWRAVLLAGVPFVAVHLLLFATMSWPIALASVLLSAVISAPLAHLYELGGRTIWAPAVVHFVVQGAIKIVTPVDGGPGLALAWMAASAVLPYAAFLATRPSVPNEDRPVPRSAS